MRYIFILIAGLVLLGGCASNIPLEIRQDISDNPVSINAVRANFDQYKDRQVRWGGTITSVENNQDDTWIEVVGKELNSWGEPEFSDETQGRFLIRVEGFLDPAIYKEDRGITVYGTIESRVIREIDEHPYTYILIKAQSHYLWSDYDSRYYARHYPYRYYYPYPYYYPYGYGLHFGYRHGYYPGYRLGFHHFHHW